MDFYTDPLAAHTTAVIALADAGIKAPLEWSKTLTRYKAFAADSDDTALTALTDAVANGTKADLRLLTALALVEAMADPVARASVRNAVRNAVLSRLYSEWKPHAANAYTQAADRFDTAAQRFTAAAAVTDVEADPATVVTADDTTRAAWADALLAAQELDTAAATLHTAAALSGIDTNGDEARLALTTNPGTVKRRTVWEAWDTEPGRCGRWAHLLAAGVTIEANRHLEQFTAYRRAAPMQEQWIDAGRGTFKRTMIDPEEPPTEAPPRKRSHRLQTF